MGIHRGPNTVKDGLVFGYDTGYGVADNSTATRFYPGQPTTNLYTNPDFSNGETGWTFSSWSSNSVTHTATTVVGPSGNIVSANKLYMGVNGGSVHFHQYNGSKYTSGNTYTTSAWVKGTGTFQIKSHWGGNTSFTMTGEWQRVSMTVTATSSINGNFPYFAGEGLAVGSDFYITDTQTELNSHVTPYVSGTRSSTASLIDLKRTTNIDVSNVSFDSTGQPTFDGSDDYISIDVDSWIRSVNSVTIEGVVIIPSGVSLTGGPWSILTDHSTNSDKDGFWWHMNLGGYTYFRVEDAVSGEQGITFTGAPSVAAGNTYHIVTIVGLNSVKIYVNGVLSKSYTPTFNWANVSASHTASLFIGRTFPGYWLNSTNPVVKVYDVALTEAEIKQNYNSYKNRFDI